MIIAVTGAGGMLGLDIVAEMYNRGHEVIPLKKKDLDITDLSRVRKLFHRKRPDIVINCAAYTDVDGAETNPGLPMAVNALGVRNLSLVCREYDIDLAHISTDYVFDGRKEESYRIYDRVNPINTYGMSKMAGEEYLTGLLHQYYLIRTSWLFGLGGTNFVEKILGLCKKRNEIMVVEDQLGSPTYTADLARLVGDLIKTRCYGIYHATNRGDTSWYGLAREIIAQTGSDISIRPLKTADLDSPAARPLNSSLDPFPLKETVGYYLPPWEDALARYLGCREEVGR